MDIQTYTNTHTHTYGLNDELMNKPTTQLTTVAFHFMFSNFSDGTIPGTILPATDPVWDQQGKELHRGGGSVPCLHAAQAGFWQRECVRWASPGCATGSTVPLWLVHQVQDCHGEQEHVEVCVGVCVCVCVCVCVWEREKVRERKRDRDCVHACIGVYVCVHVCVCVCVTCTQFPLNRSFYLGPLLPSRTDVTLLWPPFPGASRCRPAIAAFIVLTWAGQKMCVFPTFSVLH